MSSARLLRSMGIAALSLALSAPAFAAGMGGTWQRSDGAARVQFTPCGSSLCGTIVWLAKADGPAHVGQQVFFGMTQSGANSYEGSAFNPEDGKTYDGSATVAGNRMTTKGCALGGMICKTTYWVRHG